MDCAERRLLLREFIESNEEYRAAIARCKVCRSCANGKANCQLDEYLKKFDDAHQVVLKHMETHGC